MPNCVEFFVQVFVRRGDVIEPADRLPAVSGQDAIDLAGSLVPANAGAEAVLVVRDVAGEIRTATYLARYGKMPSAFGLQLRGTIPPV